MNAQAPPPSRCRVADIYVGRAYMKKRDLCCFEKIKKATIIALTK